MTGFIADTTDLLARTPVLLHTLLDGLSDSWTDTPDVSDGWRPRDVVGHLLTGDTIDWMGRVERILEAGTTVPFDRFDRFAMLERDVGVPLAELLDRFAERRAANVARLRTLVTDADLDRRGMHPTFGEVTLRHLLLGVGGPRPRPCRADPCRPCRLARR